MEMSNIKCGQKIKIFFKDGLTARGILFSISKNEMLLKAEDSDSILHIINPEENLRMIIEFSDQPTVKHQTEQQAVAKNIQIDSEPNIDIKEHAASLAELKILAAKEEKEQITKKIRSFEPSTSEYRNYGKPKFIEQYSSQEKARVSFPNIEKLRKLQGKKESQ